MTLFTGYVRYNPNGSHTAIVAVDDGPSYRVNPLGERDDFYSEKAARDLAISHAATCNARQSVKGMNLTAI